MFNFTSGYNDLLHEAWQQFINYEPFDYSFIRPEILESWKRSRTFSVDPFHLKTTILTKQELMKQITGENALLVEVAQSYMEKLYSCVKGSGFYLLLCDREGYILHIVGDREIIEHGEATSRLVVGANRSEQFAGTNAIGTCLELMKPIQTWGEEHYIKAHKNYTCSGAPIYGADGEIIGCLNITGRYTQVHPHTLGMAISAVDGISKELILKKVNRDILRVSCQRNRIIETMTSGLFLLNMEDEIIQVNSTARKMLGLKNRNIIGKTISEFIHFNEDPEENRSFLQYETYNKDAQIYLSDSTIPMNFNVSVNFVIGGNDEKDGKLVRFTEAKKINSLVNRISGFKSKFTFTSIIHESEPMEIMIRNSKKAAKSSSNVLILGESGTGKEMIAQSIHGDSSYSNGPFIAINCGALPKGLVESELFGYEKGAFTGAGKEGNPGKFELADGGTIFLDEIGEMPLDVQVLLLRVLETREIVRIGGKHPRPVDIRIIAATNRDLREEVKEKNFREDLFYRLNVFSIKVPRLKDRGGDIKVLAEYFIQSRAESRNLDVEISPEIFSILMNHEWPGNVRELENTMERALNIMDGNILKPEHLPDYLLKSGISEAGLPGTQPYVKSRKRDSRESIEEGLRATGGNIKKTAEYLGLSRRTMYRKFEKYKINYEVYRETEAD